MFKKKNVLLNKSFHLMSGDLVFLQTNDEFCQWAGGKLTYSQLGFCFLLWFCFLLEMCRHV